MPTQVILDGPRNAVVKQVGAGTIDVSTLVGAPAEVRIGALYYDVGVVADAVIAWDATVDQTIMNLSGRSVMHFSHFGGLINNAGSGKTGDIVIAGTGVFTVIFELIK